MCESAWQEALSVRKGATNAAATLNTHDRVRIIGHRKPGGTLRLDHIGVG